MLNLMGIPMNSSFPRMRESMWLISLDPRLRGDDEKGIFRGTLYQFKTLDKLSASASLSVQPCMSSLGNSIDEGHRHAGLPPFVRGLITGDIAYRPGSLAYG